MIEGNCDPEGIYVEYDDYAKLESQLQTVLQREAAKQARFDAQLDGIEDELRDKKRALDMVARTIASVNIYLQQIVARG